MEKTLQNLGEESNDFRKIVPDMILGLRHFIVYFISYLLRLQDKPVHLFILIGRGRDVLVKKNCVDRFLIVNTLQSVYIADHRYIDICQFWNINYD